MNADATHSGVPRWLAITGAAIAALAALVGIVVGLYPLVHPDRHGDHGVGAYRSLVAATCDRITAVQKNSGLPQPVRFDEAQNDWVYDRDAVISTVEGVYAAISAQLDALETHTVPKALAADHRRLVSAENEWRNQYQLTRAELGKGLPAGNVTEAQMTMAAPTTAAATAARAKLGDAFSALSGTPCSL